VHVDTVRNGPPERDPLGRELCERVERRLAGRVDGVHQTGHRRDQVGVAGQWHQRVELRGSLDQHQVGLQLGEGGRDRPGRPWAVVPDPEDVDG
jgi:hypothetical protein